MRERMNTAFLQPGKTRNKIMSLAEEKKDPMKEGNDSCQREDV